MRSPHDSDAVLPRRWKDAASLQEWGGKINSQSTGAIACSFCSSESNLDFGFSLGASLLPGVLLTLKSSGFCGANPQTTKRNLPRLQGPTLEPCISCETFGSLCISKLSNLDNQQTGQSLVQRNEGKGKRRQDIDSDLRQYLPALRSSAKDEFFG